MASVQQIAAYDSHDGKSNSDVPDGLTNQVSKISGVILKSYTYGLVANTLAAYLNVLVKPTKEDIFLTILNNKDVLFHKKNPNVGYKGLMTYFKHVELFIETGKYFTYSVTCFRKLPLLLIRSFHISVMLKNILQQQDKNSKYWKHNLPIVHAHYLTHSAFPAHSILEELLSNITDVSMLYKDRFCTFLVYDCAFLNDYIFPEHLKSIFEYVCFYLDSSNLFIKLATWKEIVFLPISVNQTGFAIARKLQQYLDREQLIIVRSISKMSYLQDYHRFIQIYGVRGLTPYISKDIYNLIKTNITTQYKFMELNNVLGIAQNIPPISWCVVAIALSSEIKTPVVVSPDLNGVLSLLHALSNNENFYLTLITFINYINAIVSPVLLHSYIKPWNGNSSLNSIIVTCIDRTLSMIEIIESANNAIMQQIYLHLFGNCKYKRKSSMATILIVHTLTHKHKEDALNVLKAIMKK